VSNDRVAYCEIHGAHLPGECPECPYEAKIAELRSKLDGALAALRNIAKTGADPWHCAWSALDILSPGWSQPTCASRAFGPRCALPANHAGPHRPLPEPPK